MNRFVIGAVGAMLMLALAACGRGTVDEELLPTRVPTLAAEAFAVTPLPLPTVAPVATKIPTAIPVAAAPAETATRDEVTATAELTGVAEAIAEAGSSLTGAEQITATADLTTTEAATETEAVTATETVTEPVESPALAAAGEVTATAEVTATEGITAEAAAGSASSLLPTATPTPETAATPEPTAQATVEPTIAAEPTAEPPVAAAPAAGAVTELPASVQAAMASADATRGQSLTLSNACIGCHSTDPKMMMVGPTWYNLAETAATRVPGQSAEAYLYNSIIHPNDFVVQGYLAGIMLQTYEQTLSDQDLADLITYLLTLHATN